VADGGPSLGRRTHQRGPDDGERVQHGNARSRPWPSEIAAIAAPAAMTLQGTSGERRPACDRRVPVDPADPGAPLTTLCSVPALLPPDFDDFGSPERAGERESQAGRAAAVIIQRAPRGASVCLLGRPPVRRMRWDAARRASRSGHGFSPARPVRRSSAAQPAAALRRASICASNAVTCAFAK
jgi:hypothetical protein